ncbi:MAG: DUF4440 domain-containing protein [Hyphomicrobium sp.]
MKSASVLGLLVIAALGLFGGADAARADTPACTKLTEVQMVQLLNRWRAAFTGGDPEQLSGLYADDAILIATKDGKPYKGRDAIRSYFKGLLVRRATMSIRPSSLHADCGTASIAGPVVYRITGERKGTRLLLGGRYQADFAVIGGEWKIVRHSLAADERRIGDPFVAGAN